MKININYQLPESTTKEVLEANKKICSVTNCDIVFSSGTCRPHITLVSGDIEEKDLETVKKIVANFSPTAINTTISFETPFIAGAYIMCNAAEKKHFETDCKNLLTALGGLVKTGKHLIANGTAAPHITLGWAQNAQNADFLLKHIKFSDTKLQKLEVSLGGPHGTVLVLSEINEK